MRAYSLRLKRPMACAIHERAVNFAIYGAGAGRDSRNLPVWISSVVREVREAYFLRAGEESGSGCAHMILRVGHYDRE